MKRRFTPINCPIQLQQNAARPIALATASRQQNRWPKVKCCSASAIKPRKQSVGKARQRAPNLPAAQMRRVHDSVVLVNPSFDDLFVIQHAPQRHAKHNQPQNLENHLSRKHQSKAS